MIRQPPRPTQALSLFPYTTLFRSHHIVTHSDSKILFVGDNVWENLNESMMENLEAIISLIDFELYSVKNENIKDAREHLNELFGKKYPNRFTPSDIKYYEDKPEELILINYTSGSTGFSKGVMLPYRSIWSNTKFCLDNLGFLNPAYVKISSFSFAEFFFDILNNFVHCCSS